MPRGKQTTENLKEGYTAPGKIAGGKLYAVPLNDAQHSRLMARARSMKLEPAELCRRIVLATLDDLDLAEQQDARAPG